jgi:hypothetical protein
MFKNRLLLILGVLSLLLVTIAVSNPLSAASSARNAGANDFHQRHPEWNWESQNVVDPVAGAVDFPDYYQRHPELRMSTGITVDLTDYFFKHPELRTSTKSVDLTDYFFRH